MWRIAPLLLLAGCSDQAAKSKYESLIGQDMRLTGGVSDIGSGAASGNPYITVRKDGLIIRCYYTSGGPAPVGQIVTIAGPLYSFDGSFGSIRPCVFF